MAKEQKTKDYTSDFLEEYKRLENVIRKTHAADDVSTMADYGSYLEREHPEWERDGLFRLCRLIRNRAVHGESAGDFPIPEELCAYLRWLTETEERNLLKLADIADAVSCVTANTSLRVVAKALREVPYLPVCIPRQRIMTAVITPDTFLNAISHGVEFCSSDLLRNFAVCNSMPPAEYFAKAGESAEEAMKKKKNDPVIFLTDDGTPSGRYFGLILPERHR